MVTFELDGKEYELKLTYKSVKHLESMYEGGSLGFVGRAMTGDLDVFANTIHAALFHTGESFAKETVEQAIEEAFDAEKIDLEYVHKTINEVVLESFFFAKVVRNLKAQNPEAFEALSQVISTTTE